MKKILLLSLTCLLALMVSACGNSKTADSEKKTADKKTETKSAETNNKESSKTNKDTTSPKQHQNASQKQNNHSANQPTKKQQNEAQKDHQKQSTQVAPKAKTNEGDKTFSLTLAGFKVSNLSPVTGGDVETTLINQSAKQALDFNNLAITVKQYKVEHVQNTTKKIDTYSPESFFQNKNGYLVTLEVAIQNKTAKDIQYKAEQMKLLNNSSEVGGSLDNFIPIKYHLSGSKADPYVFAKNSTTSGLVTFMLDDSKFAKINSGTKLSVPNPAQFDADVPNPSDNKAKEISLSIK